MKKIFVHCRLPDNELKKLKENFFLKTHSSKSIILNENYFLSQVSIMPSSYQTIAENCEFKVRVWKGGNDNNGYNPGTLILEQEVYNPIFDEWNNIQLNNPIQISLNEEI